MKTSMFLIILGLLLGGCSSAKESNIKPSSPPILIERAKVIKPKPIFSIETNQNDKFADKSILEIKSFNNKVAHKAVSWEEKEMDESSGLFINPLFLKKDKASTIYLKAMYVGKYFPKALDYSGFNYIKSIIFIVDDTTRIEIPFKAVNKFIDWTGGYKVSYTYYESSDGEISLGNYKKLVFAKTLDIKVVGDTKSQTISNNEIDKDFILNLKQFYDRAFVEKK